jgi:hypothetical protein
MITIITYKRQQLSGYPQGQDYNITNQKSCYSHLNDLQSMKTIRNNTLESQSAYYNKLKQDI